MSCASEFLSNAYTFQQNTLTDQSSPSLDNSSSQIFEVWITDGLLYGIQINWLYAFLKQYTVVMWPDQD